MACVGHEPHYVGWRGRQYCLLLQPGNSASASVSDQGHPYSNHNQVQFRAASNSQNIHRYQLRIIRFLEVCFSQNINRCQLNSIRVPTTIQNSQSIHRCPLRIIGFLQPSDLQNVNRCPLKMGGVFLVPDVFLFWWGGLCRLELCHS